jgi:hypothetical protein
MKRNLSISAVLIITTVTLLLSFTMPTSIYCHNDGLNPGTCNSVVLDPNIQSDHVTFLYCTYEEDGDCTEANIFKIK